jgi:hypothetical protein
MAQLIALRANCGRPHWVLIGEAHSLLPAEESQLAFQPDELSSSMMYVSVHPESMSPAVLDSVDALIAIGANPGATLAKYRAPLGIACAAPPDLALRPGEALAWMRRADDAPYRFAMQPSEAERKQHRRRLVEGQLPAERSFYFRGAEKKLNLRAQNLPLFLQIGMGVDEETWLHHLQQGDYSRWLHESVKDPRLAMEVADVERSSADAASSRARVSAIIGKYMQAADERAPA